MCGGGGYSAPADNSLELERMRQEEAARLREEERVRAAQEKAERIAQYNEALGKARTGAASRANSLFTSRGLDPNAYSDLISRSIEEQSSMVPYLDTNPASYYGDDFINNILNREQSGKRSQFTRRVEELFPTGFEEQYITDAMDDPFIADVLNKQKANAVLQLDRAKARGSLDDRGYSGAMTRIEDLFKQGTATGQSLGSSVLQSNRQKLRGIADEAYTRAGSYELGSSFDPNTYVTRRDARLTDINANLEGQIREALGGQNFFDIGDIITQGGITQGATNPRLALPSVLAERQRRQDAQRGLGGQGPF